METIHFQVFNGCWGWLSCIERGKSFSSSFCNVCTDDYEPGNTRATDGMALKGLELRDSWNLRSGENQIRAACPFLNMIALV